MERAAFICPYTIIIMIILLVTNGLDIFLVICLNYKRRPVDKEVVELHG